MEFLMTSTGVGYVIGAKKQSQFSAFLGQKRGSAGKQSQSGDWGFAGRRASRARGKGRKTKPILFVFGLKMQLGRKNKANLAGPGGSVGKLTRISGGGRVPGLDGLEIRT
jgi:hypothetical protein